SQLTCYRVFKIRVTKSPGWFSSRAWRGVGGAEADAAGRRRDGRHELADGVEDHFELRVVLSLQTIELPGKVFVRSQQAAQPNERSHDFDVHLHGTPAPQDAREHRDTFLGASVGHGPTKASPT